MSFLWHMSLGITREEILNDENLVVVETTENDGELEDFVQLAGDDKSGGAFTYWKNKDDGKWHLALTGYHSGMEPILHHLHDKYGEYFKENEDWFRDFSITEEEGPIVETWQEGDILNRLYSVGYMYSLGFIHDKNEPVKERLYKDYDYDFIKATFQKYLENVRYVYYPFIFMLLSKKESNYEVINENIDIIEKHMPDIFQKYPICDTYHITKREK